MRAPTRATTPGGRRAAAGRARGLALCACGDGGGGKRDGMRGKWLARGTQWLAGSGEGTYQVLRMTIYGARKDMVSPVFIGGSTSVYDTWHSNETCKDTSRRQPTAPLN